MKKLLNVFRDIDNQKRGWLFIKGHYLALDKQKHVVLGLVIFIIGSLFIDVEKGLAITFILAIAKEINDQFGFIKFLLSNKKKTGANVFDFIATVTIPIMVQLFNLYVV